MIFKDYYKILGLETTRVTLEEIRAAYRLEAKKYHPDLNVGNKLAEERIKDINEAYKILSVPTTKRKYDRKWNTYIGSKRNLFDKNKNSKEILKNMFFGEEKKEETNIVKGKAKNGENINTSIGISIYEAYYGLDKKISLKTPEGKSKEITISIPEGIKQGETIRLIGQGKKGVNGGKAGDLFITINIQDNDTYILKDNNIYTTIKLTPWEAALGTKIEIQSIDEQKTKIYIPQRKSNR